jgi:prolyl oligopeptidase
MKRICPAGFAFAAFFTLLAASATPAQTAPPKKCPPVARLDNATDTYGPVIVADPYRWLEDQQSPETRAWIDAEQSCTVSVLSKISGREAIAKRFTELFHTDDISLPREKSGRYFFSKRLAGEDLSKLYMRRGKNTPDEVLVDPLPWSADHTASAVFENVSPDGKFLYYSRRDGGQDEVAVHVLDVDARRELSDVLPAATYFSVEPAPDDRTIYYSKATKEGPRAYAHLLGTTPEQDKLLFGDSLGPDKILAVSVSEDGAYLVYVVVFGSGRLAKSCRNKRSGRGFPA